MKKIIYTFTLLVNFYLTVFMATAQNKPAQVSYTIDFVFTGKIQNTVDSLFALQYTFSKMDYAKFAKLKLEDSQKSYTIIAGTKTLSDSLEILSDAQHVYLRFHKYHKFDLPVLMNSEDKTGKKTPLYLRHSSGKFTSGVDFKEEVRGIRESVRRKQNQ